MDLVIQPSGSGCRYQPWKVNNAMLALYALVRQKIKTMARADTQLCINILVVNSLPRILEDNCDASHFQQTILITQGV